MLALYEKYKLEGNEEAIKTLMRYNSDVRRKAGLQLTHSILIPCYKPHLNKLQRLLDSIMIQTLQPNEIIIYTSQTCKEDISHLNLPNHASIYFTSRTVGPSEARNKLYHLSTCDVLSFFDADDIMHSKRCEYVMKAIQDGYDICLTRYQYSQYSTIIGEPEPYSILPMTEGRNSGEYHHGHPTIIRSVMDKIKYLEHLKEGEDVTFIEHVLKSGFKGGKLPHILTCYDYCDSKIIGRLVGGLGNQLFIIAKTLYESKRTRKPYSFIISDHDKTQGHHSTKYTRLLKNVLSNQFNTNEQHIQYTEKIWSYYDAREDVDTYMRHGYNIVLNGYWQSEKHFPDMKDDIRSFLGINTDGIDQSCLIMVRRGDYLRFANIHNPCPLSYYLEAMSKLREKGINKFMVTSDDLDWCRRELPEAEILDMDDEDLFYYAVQFKHFIISNSSYHWFVSYLANADNIIAPSHWIKLEGIDCSSVYRDDMTIITRE